MRRRIAIAMLTWLVIATACGEAPEPAAEEVQIDVRLGTLTVGNETDEPVTIYLDGDELYSVPPQRSYTFRNLPLREVDIYGVGRVSDRHFGLPKLTIEEGGEYEWTIRP